VEDLGQAAQEQADPGPFTDTGRARYGHFFSRWKKFVAKIP